MLGSHQTVFTSLHSFPPLALTSISHPLAPSRGQTGSWMDAGRRDSRGLLTLAFVGEILGESLAQTVIRAPNTFCPSLGGAALSSILAAYTRQAQSPGQLPYLLLPVEEGPGM